MRLFAAVELPQRQLDSVEAAVAPLRGLVPGARWTDRSSWHVTVKFFGEVPDQEVGELTGRIESVAGPSRAVDSRLLDVGAFPTLRRARVLWVGIDDSRARLEELHRDLSRATGYPEEKRRFHPHLTLARLKLPGSVEKVVRDATPLDLDRSEFGIERLTLFRSHLSPRGARYEVVGRVEFCPGPGL